MVANLKRRLLFKRLSAVAVGVKSSRLRIIKTGTTNRGQWAKAIRAEGMHRSRILVDQGEPRATHRLLDLGSKRTNEPMADQSDLRLVFLDTALFDTGTAIRGGALITDIETKPYEFRCTSPVRPTQLQRVLYGDTLEEYIYVELIGLPLIKATKEKPSLILVRNAVLLPIRPLISYPVVLLSRDQKSAIDTGQAGDLKPVAITSHREFSAEATSAQAMLAPLIHRRDLLEPFERLHVALIEAHKQRIGEESAGGARA